MVNNFLKAGLQDLCVSRTSFKWGVPVDFDPKHVIYVWIDALSNYITALGYDVDEQGELFQKYWPADVHIIGKDILRFHTIYWPIMLMALDVELPKKVFGHPWLNFGTDKMSKSKGNVIYADDLVEMFGVDAVRHYCLAEMPYGSDGSISYENIIARYNSDLANNLGNLVNRTIAMTKKYFDGIVPTPDSVIEDVDVELKNACSEAVKKVKENMDTYHIADASDCVFNLLRRANKYIDETTPWVLAKDEANKARLGTVMYNLLETIRIASVLLNPFLTETSEKIFKFINTDVTDYESVLTFGNLVSGREVGEASVLFERIDEKKLLEEIEAKKKASEEKVIEKPADANVCEIAFDDFMKVELRCAQVIACEPVPKAKKLLKLQLDLGYEKRQVVSGIAKFYKPEDLIGKKVALVANLKPAVLCGVESNGMILASGEEDVKVIFLDPTTENGARIR